MYRSFVFTAILLGLLTAHAIAQISAPVDDGSPPADAETELAYSTVELTSENDVGLLEFRYTDTLTGNVTYQYRFATEDDANSSSSFGPPKIPPNPTTPPGPGWEWRPTTEPVGGPIGGWYNPGTGETLHPDLNHPQPKGPHWGWKDPYGNQWDFFPDPAPGKWKPNPAHPNNPNKPQPTFPPGTEPTPIPTNRTVPWWLKLLRAVPLFLS